MHTIPNPPLPAPGKTSKVSSIKRAVPQKVKPAAKAESPEERVERFYSAENGPLMAWLVDECHSRGDELPAMAAELGVTYGYLNQLLKGIRKTHESSHNFCVACARYLGVPTIAVKIVANVVLMSDFLPPNQTEAEAIERAIRRVQTDPVMRKTLPMDLSALPFEAKKAIAAVYVQFSNNDVFNLKDLPAIVHWCHKAALRHDDKTFESRD